MPAFASWTASPATIAPVIVGRSIHALAFFDGGVFLAMSDASGDLGLWENDRAGNERRLASLGPPPGGRLTAPGPTPDGAHLWFRQDAFAPGTYLASRADGWRKELATLGFVDVLTARPSPVAFHDGTARMVVQVQGAASAKFVEIESIDGLTWSMLDTFQLSVGGLPIGAYLSPDGCMVIVNVQAGAFYELHAAMRDAGGAFSGPTTKLDTGGFGCCLTVGRHDDARRVDPAGGRVDRVRRIQAEHLVATGEHHQRSDACHPPMLRHRARPRPR